MRKIRDVWRLTHALGMSRRLAGEATGTGKSAVGDYVRRAAIAGIGWPIPNEIDDAELERRLFPPMDAASSVARSEPDCAHVRIGEARRIAGVRDAAGRYKAAFMKEGEPVIAPAPIATGGRAGREALFLLGSMVGQAQNAGVEAPLLLRALLSVDGGTDPAKHADPGPVASLLRDPLAAS